MMLREIHRTRPKASRPALHGLARLRAHARTWAFTLTADSNRLSLTLTLTLTLCIFFPAFISAQSIELNLRVLPGTASEAYLSSRSGNVPTALLRDTRQVPHMQACTQVAAFPCRKAGPMSSIFSLRFPGTDAQARIAALMATGQFAWVEENRVHPLHLPVDSSNDARVGEQWYHANIQTFASWDITRGNPDIVVGVLDTGLDYDHPEFDGQVAVNGSEDRNSNGHFDAWPDTVVQDGVTGDLDGIDQDQNGYADDVIGFDFTDQPRSPFGGDYLFPDSDPLDENNHGTLVSGIIAAKADNAYGGTGIAPGCRIKVLRAFSASGSGEDDDIARAIIYAADNGIQILNFSFGDIYPSLTMHAAIQFAYSKGVVMVGSSGNGTGDNLHYPSSFDEVISVGASTLSFDGQSEVLWPLSSFGHALSLVAPGSGILCPRIRDTFPEIEDFDTYSGTSTSAPMVSAAVALLFSQRGVCSPQQVRGILTSTAEDISEPGWDHYTGAGRLNILRALQSVGASNVQLLSPGNDSGTAADSLWIIASTLDPQGQLAHLDYKAGIEDIGPWLPIRSGITGQVLADTLAVWDLSSLQDGEYTLRLRLEKSNGTTAEDRVRVVLDRTLPVVDLRHAVMAWDNEVRKFMVVFRNSDRGVSTLRYRPLGDPIWRSLVHDRNTRNGALVLGPDRLEDAAYEFQLSCRNEAGLEGFSAIDTMLFQSAYVQVQGYEPTGLSLPMGHYLDEIQDFDGDGLDEVLMSTYDENLSFGKLRLYEYNAIGFTAIDSIGLRPILIPKSVADADGDGRSELLCSVNDSTFILEQSATGGFPDQLIYENAGQGLYPATFADVDDDNALELLVKNQKDYKVMERAGGAYSVAATLADTSGGFLASVAPLALVADFDGDNDSEVLFGDFDGDLSLYEHTAGGYALRWIDTTSLTQSGGYLSQGDFDGDGKPEFFVAAHSALNRNEVDFEYEAAFWHLRIFKSTTDNTYLKVWEDFLYDIDTDNYNAATAANIDLDAADELIFTTFPRTYVLDWTGSGYAMDWFHYGALCTHHMAGDFDNDGIQEFALGRGDTAFFFQKDANYAGTPPVAHLEGHVVDANTTSLKWSAVPNATGYRIWRGDYNGPGNVQINLIDSTASTSLQDAGLVPGQAYLYVVDAKNPALSPVYSPFSYAILLQAHSPGRLDSALATSPTQVRLVFDVPVVADESTHGLFLLDNQHVPLAVVSGADQDQSLLLLFEAPFSAGTHTISVDSSFLDAALGRLALNGRTTSFDYLPIDQRFAFFSAWEVAGPQTARIHFNLPMQADVLDPQRWQVAPYGRVTEVAFTANGSSSVELALADCALGALGYPVSITLNGGTAIDGSPMREKEGNTATFSENKPDLQEVYVYPNPYRSHDLYPGIRFANLTKQASITVLSASGEKVISLQENDGDGGLDWDLMDLWGERVKPGVYLYKVEAEGVESFLGKFSVLE